MAKSRMIARSISIDKELNELSLKSQLIFTWCIPFLDDFGLITNDVGNIKYLVFPRNPQVNEKDIKNFISEAEKLIELLPDCIFFKGFSKNNNITEYKKATSEFQENRYNKGKSKLSPGIPRNPQELPSEDSVVQVSSVKDNSMQTNVCTVREKLMKYDEPTIQRDENGDEIEPEMKFSLPRGFLKRIAYYYMQAFQVPEKEGLYIAYLPTIKSMVELAKEIHGEDAKKIEAEIKSRMDKARQFMDNKKWGRMKMQSILENWNQLDKMASGIRRETVDDLRKL